MTGAANESRFLPNLTTAFKAINVDEDIATAEYVAISPILVGLARGNASVPAGASGS
jgi:hypothetical protein